jgi:hypothetical protein
MAGALRAMPANVASKLDRNSLNEEISKLNLFAEDDQAWRKEFLCRVALESGRAAGDHPGVRLRYRAPAR